jgi:hypothetical protein
MTKEQGERRVCGTRNMRILTAGCWIMIVLGVAAAVLTFAQRATLPAARASSTLPVTAARYSMSPERRGIATVPDLAARIKDPPQIDERRSLVVTDKAILDHFSFTEVMSILARGASDPGLSPLQLFQHWWSSQTSQLCPALRFGFTFDCRREAANMAQQDDPFSMVPPDSGYIPIGLFNRIDLAPLDGSDCGEYRIIFARKPHPQDPNRRLLVNFEAVLPNPEPALGLVGCRPIAEFWHGLRLIEDPTGRARELRRFYFEGLAGFRPVVYPENYGARVCASGPCATGQIRTNERLELPWMLREFRFVPEWATTPARFRIVPVPVKSSPFGGLVCCETSGMVTAEMLVRFRGEVARVVRDLVRPDLPDKPGLHDFNHTIDAEFDSGQSISEAMSESDLSFWFSRQPPTAAQMALRTAIQAELHTLGSGLQPHVVIARARALSCAGCHHLSSPMYNKITSVDLDLRESWPNSLGFEHISEQNPEKGPDGIRYRVSDAVTAFIAKRKEALGYVLTR